LDEFSYTTDEIVPWQNLALPICEPLFHANVTKSEGKINMGTYVPIILAKLSISIGLILLDDPMAGPSNYRLQFLIAAKLWRRG